MSTKVQSEEVHQPSTIDAVGVEDDPACGSSGAQTVDPAEPVTPLPLEYSPPLAEPSDAELDEGTEPTEREDDVTSAGPGGLMLPTFRINERLFERTSNRDYFDGWEVALACHDAGFSVVPLRRLQFVEAVLPDLPRADLFVAANILPYHGKLVARRFEPEGVRLICWAQASKVGSYKAPACAGWQSLPFDLTWWEPWRPIQVGDKTYRGDPLRLVGVRTGDGLVVVDIDMKDGKNGFAALLARFGERLLELFPPTLVVATPSGGGHLYYRTTARIGNAPLAPGVDIRGEGGLVVAPGSIAVNGRRYEITNLVEPAVLPDETAEILRALSAPRGSAPENESEEDDGPWNELTVEQRRKRAAKYLAKMPPSIQGENGSGACFKAAIAMVRGFALPPDDAVEILRSEYNPRCQPPWSDTELRHKVDDALAKGRIALGALIKMGSNGKKKRAAPPPPAGTTGAPWEQALVRSEFGKVLPWSANADTVLEHDQQWAGVLGFDELRNGVVFLASPPADFLPRKPGDEWTDEDDTALCNWLQRRWEINVSPNVANAAVVLAARRRSFHPIRDELRRVAWDGVGRINTWLSTYLGVADTPYSRRVGRWWLISAVARVERPGCKVDTMLILEGPQGARKSSALRLLAGDKYFLDDLGDVGNVEAKKQLRGKWIVEMAELDSLRKAEASTIKQFLSRQFDNYRASYGRAARDYPRQCVFAGTTNHEEYLHDETGARRFWPVRVGIIDLIALERDRAQLWAEALHLFNLGERYWPEGLDEVSLFSAEQETRQAEETWTDTVAAYVADKERVGSFEILTSCLGYEKNQIKQADSRRVAAVLRSLGWIRRGRGSVTENEDGCAKRRQPRMYERGPNAEEIQRKRGPRKDPPLRASQLAGGSPILHAMQDGEAGGIPSADHAFNGAPDPSVDINKWLA